MSISGYHLAWQNELKEVWFFFVFLFVFFWGGFEDASRIYSVYKSSSPWAGIVWHGRMIWKSL